MQKAFFKVLLKLNKILLPSVSKINLYKMSKTDKVLVAYKYWVITHALD